MPPSSLTPGYASAYNGDMIRDVCIVFTVLEITAVALRFVAKRHGGLPYGVDDWLVVAALINCLALNLTALVGLHFDGAGHHMDVVLMTDPKKVILLAKFLVAVPILYDAAVCFSKLVILAFYLRIFVTKFHRIATFILIGIVITVAVVDIVTSALVCVPLRYLWDKSVDGYCVDITALYRFGTLPNPVTDFFMLLLPLPMVWRLQMSTRAKIGLAATFLTGSFGLAGSIVRTVEFFGHPLLVDTTWYSTYFVSWSIVEPGCTLIAACLICYRSLLNLVASKANRLRGSSASLHKRSGFSFSRQATRSAWSKNDIDLITMERETYVVSQSRKELSYPYNNDEEVLFPGRVAMRY